MHDDPMGAAHEKNGKWDDNGEGTHRSVEQSVHFENSPFRDHTGHEGVGYGASGLAEQSHENERDPVK